MSKYILLIGFFFTITIQSTAQSKKGKNHFFKQQKALTLNALALAEPQAAAGIGFSNTVTARSGYFTELSYIFKAPFYRGADPVTGGYRWLLQYRYSLLKNRRRNNFWGAEFRLKGYGFTGMNTFINKASNDTLTRFSYKANATSAGGAVLFGTIFNLTKSSHRQMEMSAGIGAKQKFVKYKNLHEGYELYDPPFNRKPDALRPPEIDEAVGMPYFPIAIRVRYQIY